MSIENYHKSTSNELLALTNKVRELIQHWGEDGRYKEAVFKNILRRFLPEKYLIGTGFVVRQTDNRGEHLASKQIDIIIYDNESPILFKEGDFVILAPDSVRGIVEIKANLQNQNITNIVSQANENGRFIFESQINRDNGIFNGIFSFEGYANNFDLEILANNINSGNNEFIEIEDHNKFIVNHITLNKNWFIKYWEGNQPPFSMYKIEDLSFSFFISNLIDFLVGHRIRRNNYIWFAEDKELNLIKTF